MWKAYKKYLKEAHKDEIIEIMKHEDIFKHFSLCIQYINLFDISNFGNELLKNPSRTIKQSDDCLKEVQSELLESDSKQENLTKKIIHTRIYELPGCPEIQRTKFPTKDDVGYLLQVSGTVVRITTKKMLEYQRNYICMKCKYSFLQQADYDKRYAIIPPKKCCNPDGECKAIKIIPLNNSLVPENCRDYQEVKIQEKIGKHGVGSMPSSMWVTLEDDLIDNCKPGDNVTICGIVKRRWGPLIPGKKNDVELVIKAYHVQVNNQQNVPKIVTKEIRHEFEEFWSKHKENVLGGRDIILKSLCPHIFGLHVVKLAIAVVLAGGTDSCSKEDNHFSRIRSQSHILLIGDPGTGKSQLLKFAANVIPRSVLTTGIGSTSAGLTVSAVKENGEWQLEAGALVLADGGICCIDEFNSMKEQDRLSIHEAMEQQTISVAKAGIVCKLRTRCSIVAATNPKGKIDPDQPLSINTGLATPLLSRFDLVFILRDKVDSEWDQLVADYILNDSGVSKDNLEVDFWTIERLQVYFNTVKSLQPKLTSEANLVLSTYYQYQRRAPSRNKARTTVRLLDSLVRLSQGHARLMYRTEVTVMDAVVTIYLVELSMHEESTLIPNHFNNIHLLFPQNSALNYCKIAKDILTKLELQNLLHKELQKNINVRQYLHIENDNSNGIIHQSHSTSSKDISILNDSEVQESRSQLHSISKKSTVNLNSFTKEKSVEKSSHESLTVNTFESDLTKTEVPSVNIAKQVLKNSSPMKVKSTAKRKKIINNIPNNKKIKMKEGTVKNEKETKLTEGDEEVQDYDIFKQIPSVNDDFGCFTMDSNTFDSPWLENEDSEIKSIDANVNFEQFQSSCNKTSKITTTSLVNSKYAKDSGGQDKNFRNKINVSKQPKNRINLHKNVFEDPASDFVNATSLKASNQEKNVHGNTSAESLKTLKLKLSRFKFKKKDDPTCDDSKNVNEVSIAGNETLPISENRDTICEPVLNENPPVRNKNRHNSLFDWDTSNFSEANASSSDFPSFVTVAQYEKPSETSLASVKKFKFKNACNVTMHNPQSNVSAKKTSVNETSSNIFSQIDEDFDFDNFNLDL